MDTSALIAVIRGEPEGPALMEALLSVSVPRMAAGTWLETAIVAEGKAGPAGAVTFDEIVVEAGIEVVPVTPALARRARDAWRRFGKGRHPAGLNFGDCFAYALAQERGEPLLFKGDDFARTDVKPAI